MIRKIFMAAALTAVGLIVLNHAGLHGYGATALHKIKGVCKSQVPIEFEIERLKYQIAELVPDMRRNLSSIAEEMVATANLRDEIQETHANLAKQKDAIVSMTKDLETGATSISYGGRDYARERIREKLNRDFRSYQRCEAELKSKEKLLDAKERALDSAREQLGTIRTQKQELEVQVAQLEAELKSVRLAQSRSKFQIDDSALARCKATLADIKNRLKVEQKTTELTGDFANDNTVQVEKTKPAGELTKEITAYFNEGSTEAKVAERK